jgi:hypothetical protein
LVAVPAPSSTTAGVTVEVRGGEQGRAVIVEDLVLGAGQVVLGQRGDGLEQPRPCGVVEQPRRQRTRRAAEAGDHGGAHRGGGGDVVEMVLHRAPQASRATRTPVT